MPTNNFKLFDENKANLLTDTEYGNSTQRLNGVQTGVASSQLNNKFAYQVSLVAYAIAQLMNANGLDASDTLAVSAFVGNLQGAILQKVADKATSAEAAAGVLSNKYITPETMKAAALLLSGGVMNGILDMGNNRITNLGTPTADSDAVTKGYVDGVHGFEFIYSGSFSLTKESKTITIDKNLSDYKILLFCLSGISVSVFDSGDTARRIFIAESGTQNCGSCCLVFKDVNGYFYTSVPYSYYNSYQNQLRLTLNNTIVVTSRSNTASNTNVIIFGVKDTF